MTLEAAQTRLREGKLPEAVRLLVKEWCDTPLPELAQVIDSLAERLPKGPIESHKAWMLAAKKGSGDDLPTLLATLCSGTISDTEKRVSTLRTFGRDPRIASVLLGVVRDAPFTSNGSRKAWVAIFDCLATLDDPRVIDRVPEAKLGWKFRAAQRDWLSPRADALVERVRKRFPEGVPKADPKTAKLLAEIQAAIAERVPEAKKAQAGSAQDLLAAIYDSPQDDKLRSVYADWLEEQGDPRGEFIALQLQPDRSKQMLARERALLKAHERDWIGAIAPVVTKKDTEFERGFLVGCHVRFKSERDVRAYGSLPEWATVERLRHGLPGSPPRDQMKWLTWIDPAMKSLRDVSVFADSLRTICASPQPWRIERISFGAWQRRRLDEDEQRLLETTDKLPHLKALVLHERPRTPWLSKARFAAQLRELTVHGVLSEDEDHTFADFMKDIEKLPNLDKLIAVLGWKQNITFMRDASGRHSVARVEMSPSAPWDVCGALDQLPLGSLTELEVAVHPEFAKQTIDPARLELLRTSCKRHKTKSLDLTAIEARVKPAR